MHEKVNGLGEGTLSTVRPYLTDTLHKLLAERGIDLSVVLLQSLNQVNTGKSLPHDHDSRASYTRRLCNAIVSAVHASRRQGTAHAASPTGAVLLFVALNQRHARVHSSGTSRPLSDSESSNVLRIMSANLKEGKVAEAFRRGATQIERVTDPVYVNAARRSHVRATELVSPFLQALRWFMRWVGAPILSVLLVSVIRSTRQQLREKALIQAQLEQDERQRVAASRAQDAAAIATLSVDTAGESCPICLDSLSAPLPSVFDPVQLRTESYSMWAALCDRGSLAQMAPFVGGLLLSTWLELWCSFFPATIAITVPIIYSGVSNVTSCLAKDEMVSSTFWGLG